MATDKTTKGYTKNLQMKETNSENSKQAPKKALCKTDVSRRYYLTKDRQGNYQVLNELAYEKKLIYG